MSQLMHGNARSRPIRIAFLMEEGEQAHQVLDGIFASSYGRWGGRYSPIVLCENQRIPDAYWNWLQAFDPDIVYSYVCIAREAILEIHERLNPAEYFFHQVGGESQRRDVYGFTASLSFKPLSSLSTIFRLVRSPRLGAPMAPVKIIDAWPGHHPTRMLTDNFGLYHWSMATGMFPPDAGAAAQLLTIAEPDARARNAATMPRDRPLIEGECEAMSAFARGEAHSMAQASMLCAPKLDIHAGAWSGTFNLVIGDTVTDRLLFWNARLLIPDWLADEPCCFRASLDELREPAFAAALRDLLRYRNHVGGNGPSQTTMRSLSLTAAELEEAAQIVRDLDTWGVMQTEHLTDLRAMLPEARTLEEARETIHSSSGLSNQVTWTRFERDGEVARPPETPPEHLSDVPPNQSFGSGAWATDFQFQYQGVGIWLSNSNQWMLPARWRAAGAFKASYVHSPQFELFPPARRSRAGALCLFASREVSIEQITVPTAAAALQYALAGSGIWREDDVARGRVTPPPKVSYAFSSNEARYLTGVLGMAGDLTTATNLLLHPFLRDLFARFGGTPNLPAAKVQPTINDLRKRARHHPAFDLHSEQERTVLANMLLKASRQLKSPMGWISLDTLKRDWKTYRDGYWSKEPLGEADRGVEWESMEADSLDACLIYMRSREMIFQGYQWSCANCHHRNWVNFDALAHHPPCVVCKAPKTMPVAIDWMFRPNAFLVESLRDHSVLSLLWTLATLAQRASRSFIHVGPTAFSFDPDSHNPDAEADLLVLCDGEAIICEAKASWSHLRATDIAKLLALAKRLRPNKALLAVMDDQIVLQAELAAAKTELESEGIAFEVLRFDPRQEPHEPYLRYH